MPKTITKARNQPAQVRKQQQVRNQHQKARNQPKQLYTGGRGQRAETPQREKKVVE